MLTIIQGQIREAWVESMRHLGFNHFVSLVDKETLSVKCYAKDGRVWSTRINPRGLQTR